VLLSILIAVLFTFGIYLISCDYFRIPFMKTAKTVKNLTDRQNKKASMLNVWINNLSVWLSKFIKLNKYKKSELKTDLDSAGIKVSPELHIAKAIVKAIPVGLLAIPAFYIFPLIFPLIVALAFMLYLRDTKEVQQKLEKKRLAIEFELPRFVSTIEKTLKYNRDLITLIDKYIQTASPEMKHELSITVSAMRSGNYKAAIKDFQVRINSPMLSDVASGLLIVLQGDDTEIFWANLSLRIANSQKQLLISKAQKVPKKVKRLSMCLLGCFMLCYFVVIGQEVLTSLGAMFG